MRTELNIDQDTWIQDAAVQLPIAWRNSLYEKAEANQGRAIPGRIGQSSPSRQTRSQPRSKFAISHLLRTSSTEKRSLDECQIFQIPFGDLQQISMQLSACMTKQSQLATSPTMLFNEPVLTKSSLMLAHGDREGAIKAATEQYWHSIRIHGDSDKLKSFLRAIGCRIDSASANQDIQPTGNSFFEKTSEDGSTHDSSNWKKFRSQIHSQFDRRMEPNREIFKCRGASASS